MGRTPAVLMASTRAGNPEGFRGWDFLSTPVSRLKPGVNEKQFADQGLRFVEVEF